MNLLERLAAVQERGGRAVLFTVVEGEGAGTKWLVEEGETGVELADEADEVIRGARNTLLELEGRKVFGEVYMPPPRLLVYGAVDTAEALCKAAKNLGWTTYVADARRAFATVDRFPSADELIVEWPRRRRSPGSPPTTRPRSSCSPTTRSSTSPRCETILQTEAFYVGALGSRRNQEKRRARLLEAGVSEAALERIAGPCGLDIGAESQEETALSILGEILAVRAGRAGRAAARRQAPHPRAGRRAGPLHRGVVRAALALAAALCLVAPPLAEAHSLVRERGGRIAYLARDATSLNSLTVRAAGRSIVLRDEAVAGGIDPGPCRATDVDQRTFDVIEVRCRAARVVAALGDREDRATVAVAAELRGGAGADDLAGGPAADVLLGGDGADRLAAGAGGDRLAGGPADDALAGAGGADALDGGLGRDRLDGGAGDDVLRARDGQADELLCGDGADRVEADTLDRVAADCERVERIAIPAPPEPGPAAADDIAPRVRAGREDPAAARARADPRHAGGARRPERVGLPARGRPGAAGPGRPPGGACGRRRRGVDRAARPGGRGGPRRAPCGAAAGRPCGWRSSAPTGPATRG